MRIKELFVVPEGEKVTEKVFGRVLLSSLCSILLCMACLVSTTWAWFCVSIENEGNVIQIANVTASVKVTSGGELMSPSADGSFSLGTGTYSLQIGLGQGEKTADGANLLNDSKCPVYVVMAINHEGSVKYRSFKFTSKEEVKESQLTVGTGYAVISFSVSWVMPAGVQPVEDEAVVIGEIPTEPISTASTESQKESTGEPDTGA